MPKFSQEDIFKWLPPYQNYVDNFALIDMEALHDLELIFEGKALQWHEANRPFHYFLYFKEYTQQCFAISPETIISKL